MTSDLLAVAFVLVGILGLAASFVIARRRGFTAATRVAAWSLLVLGLWLVGATRLVARLVSAVGSFATGLVFSPVVWVGLVLIGLAVVLFVVGAGLRGRALRRAGTAAPKRTSKPAATTGRAAGPAVSAKPAGAGDDDFGEIEDILRRRGIT